ncbi:heparanase-like isoform X2 [Aphis gossypii]|uniref:heparanase-like isoform X2 n=1 Tax=Aphis gossypii TaxID=80765 RepID=UPI0021590FAE|nr:heparanase-like isoform X2 [Aphis gossypii]
MKNQYKNLDGHESLYASRRLRLIQSPLIVILCFIFLVFSQSNLSQSLSKGERHIFILNPKQPLLHTSSTKFLSFSFDTYSLRKMNELPISDERFINLARLLSPAYVRIGGTSADCLFFNESPPQNSHTQVTSPIDGNHYSNFTFSEEDFLSLYQFTKKSGLRMLFDLNVLIRNPDGSWNDSNARQIVEFAKYHEMTLDWQLGNVGPEVDNIKNPINITYQGQYYVKEFLKNDEDCIDYVTWHQYYINGRTAKVQDFIDPKVFNILSKQIKSLQDVIDGVGKKIPMWLSETSTAFGGGARNISDRFVAGFLFLDKLGYSASEGLQVVIRQSFFNGHYAMVGPDLNPNAVWWVSVFYKEFVSNKVLKLATINNFGNVRLYAHCTPEKSLVSRVPAVTVFGMNLHNYSVNISIQGYKSTPKITIFMYALTSDDLQSRTIKLNGKDLNLLFNGDLPPFKPVILKIGKFITLPAHSMVFIVMHGIDIPACFT